MHEISQLKGSLVMKKTDRNSRSDGLVTLRPLTLGQMRKCCHTIKSCSSLAQNGNESVIGSFIRESEMATIFGVAPKTAKLYGYENTRSLR